MVTGSGRGIGKAIAMLLAQSGAKVAVNDVDSQSALATCRALCEDGFPAIAVPGDVNDPKAVDELVQNTLDEFHSIDILVNNAAAPADFVPFECSTLQIQAGELTTLVGTLHCTRSVLPGMIENRRGRIISITSISGRYGQPSRAIYSAAKAGMTQFSKALSAEVGQYGITVNCVSPGATDSPRFLARSEEFRDEHRKLISLGRFIQPEEVAQAVLFLASDMANAITGTVIDVDGGSGGFIPERGRAGKGNTQ